MAIAPPARSKYLPSRPLCVASVLGALAAAHCTPRGNAPEPPAEGGLRVTSVGARPKTALASATCTGAAAGEPLSTIVTKASDVAVADFNADGNSDIVVLENSFDPNNAQAA